jgi:hypothetical protein
MGLGLGLGMKKIIIITFFAVIVPLLVFGFIGCVKAPSAKIDYGPEISAAEIQDALSEVLQAAPTNPLSIQKDQYIYVEHTQALDVYSPILISQRADTITDRALTETEFDLGIDIQLNELQNDGTMQFSRSHSDLQIPLNSSSAITATSFDGSSSSAKAASAFAWIHALTTPELVHIQDYSLRSIKAQEENPDPKVTYHNLQRNSGIMPVPDLVKARTDCGGIADCDRGIRYVEISFDRVVWSDENNGTKTSIDYIFSPDVPTYIYDWANSDDLFFTNQISECAQQWIPQTTNNTTRYIPVRDCRDLLDFHFGPTPSLR